MNIHLLTIDPQRDFCDKTIAKLYVPQAEDDMDRLAALIMRRLKKINQIHSTMDSHQTVHIAHPIYWKAGHSKTPAGYQPGDHPKPFTTITHPDTEDGVWVTTNPKWEDYGRYYTGELKRHGRYQLMIWPPHCRIGTPGHTLMPCIDAAFTAWEEQFEKVNFVTKGSNINTEHYSALMADVPDPKDLSTGLNTKLIDTINQADEIWVAAEALSHCVANTVTDLADNFGESNIKKLVLIEDCTSNVGGCEQMGKDFVQRMTKRGMRLAKSIDL